MDSYHSPAAAERPPPPSPQPSPSRRRAQDSERRRARSWGGSQLGVSASSRGFAEAEVPTHEATDCTFAPQINGDARARRPRTVDELSAGDAQRRSQAHAVLKQRAETQATESLTFKPEINAVSGVQSRLKVSSEPESYLARVRQHMALKEKVTACVREAEGPLSSRSAPSTRRRTRRQRTSRESPSRCSSRKRRAPSRIECKNGSSSGGLYTVCHKSPAGKALQNI